MKKVAHELSFGAPNSGDDGVGGGDSPRNKNNRLMGRFVGGVYGKPWLYHTCIVLAADHSLSGTVHAVVLVTVPLLDV